MPARDGLIRRMSHPDAGSMQTICQREASDRRGERRPDVPGATDPERSTTGCRQRRVQ